MQSFQILAILGLAATSYASPIAEAEAVAEPIAEPTTGLLGIPLLDLSGLLGGSGGNTVSCSSGSVFFSNDGKTYYKKSKGDKCTTTPKPKPGGGTQTGTTGSVVCCNSAAGLLNVPLIAACGNTINIPVNIPITLSVLS